MTADLYLKNAKIADEHEVFHGGVAIEGEHILQVVRGRRRKLRLARRSIWTGSCCCQVWSTGMCTSKTPG